MERDVQQLKKSMPLAKFEFNLFKELIQLERTFGLENKKILLNLQISGGKDSMCLLNACAAVLFSKVCKLKNTYILVAQHFNHKQRLQESEEDAFFVAKECLNKGIPVYLSSLSSTKIKGNFQDYARSWRKAEAKKLSSRLKTELNCEKYFIVTAHHARDHVETVLLHLLRGSGVNGLKGIPLFDEGGIYFRPFCAVSYQEITNYSKKFNIHFQEDSSNLSDKYKRNYVRQHILPHFEHLQKDYENSFVKLSRHILSEQRRLSLAGTEMSKEKSLNVGKDNFCVDPIIISKNTSCASLFHELKLAYEMISVSENCIKNILHEAHILLQKKEDEFVKKIPINLGGHVKLIKRVNSIELYYFLKEKP